MDISRLIPYIKRAAMEVTPEEVAFQLQKSEKARQEDKERETVDNEVIEQDEKPIDEAKNEEGALLEGSFQELDIEDAVEKAKEEKLLAGNPQPTPPPGNKVASYWEILQSRIR